MTSQTLARTLLSPAAALVLLSCAGTAGGGGADGWTELTPESPSTGAVMPLLGTVRYLDLEGGLYVIETADGNRYNPVNLPEAFRAEGKTVEAEARRRDDVMSIGMVGPVVELLRIRERSAGPLPEATAPASDRDASLAGTSWRLEDLMGRGVVDAVEATLEFPDEGTASGSGSCNRFRGIVTLRGDAITFGPLAATRKGCPDAIMRQETAYLEALGQARRYEVRDGTLSIYTAGGSAPLRFVRL